MKCILPSVKLANVEEFDGVYALSASITDRTIFTNNWGGVAIIDIDSGFPLYCKLLYGWSPIEITDEEYLCIARDGIAFLGKARRDEVCGRYRRAFVKNMINM